MIKKLLLSLLLLFTVTGLFACDSTTSTTTATPVVIPSDSHQATVDETIYINADATGEIESLVVVSRIKNALPGYYTEYGDFLSAQNLSGSESILVGSDRLEIPIAEACDDFYYRTQLSPEYEVPFLLTFNYEKNGLPIDPIVQTGEAGNYDIEITVTSNPNADLGFVNQFMCYLQLSLDADKTSFPTVSGGSVVLAGGTYTIAFMTLPGASAVYTLSVETTSFSISSIQASFTRFDPSILGDQLADFGENMSTLITGLTAIRDGQITMKAGLTEMHTAIAVLSAGSSELSDGLDAILTGISQMADAATTLASNLAVLSQATDQLATSGSTLTAGYANLMIAVNDVVSTFSSLHADDVALLTKLMTLSQTAAAIETALGTYVGGVSSCAENLALLSAGMNQLATSLTTIKTTLIDINSGASDVSIGLAALTSALAGLPDSIEVMINAQTLIIDNLTDSLSEMQFLFNQPETLISYTSPDNPSPNSIQFVYTIPAF
ncbi:MAG: hypothetical protein WC479_03845 [Candidatus Izemoplasmatales bacterium]|jgi:hypothetical protein